MFLKCFQHNIYRFFNNNSCIFKSRKKWIIKKIYFLLSLKDSLHKSSNTIAEQETLCLLVLPFFSFCKDMQNSFKCLTWTLKIQDILPELRYIFYELYCHIIDTFYASFQVVCLVWVHVEHFDLRESSSLHYQRQKSKNSNNWRQSFFLLSADYMFSFN